MIQYPLKLIENILISSFDISSEKKYYLLQVDDRNIKISEPIFILINIIDGKKTIEEIATEYSTKMGVLYSSHDIDNILQTFFIPNQLIITDKLEVSNDKGKSDIIFRYTLFSIKIIIKFTSYLKPLFHKSHITIFLFLSIILHIYHLLILKPQLYPNSIEINHAILAYFIYFVSVLFHELGHASACYYHGITPGKIGIGLYYYLPVFYADVSSIWKLKRNQRALVDFGGIYFQLIFQIPIYIMYYFTNYDFLLLSIYFIDITIVFNLNPFFKFDGYWLFSDITGIHNLHKSSSEFVKYHCNKLLRKNNVIKPFIFEIKPIWRIIAVLYVFASNIFLLIVLFFIISFLFVFINDIPIKVQHFHEFVLNLTLNDWSSLYLIFKNILFPLFMFIIAVMILFKIIKRIFKLFI